MPLRCFFIRCDICLRRQAHILFLDYILLIMFCITSAARL
nr:MAG TPA: hypothetical protein [Caudoviricetes sp.]